MPKTMTELQSEFGTPPTCPTCLKPMVRSCFHSNAEIGWEDFGSWHCQGAECHGQIRDTNYDAAMAHWAESYHLN